MNLIGFKEWQVVCDALASGKQTIILRKGGIHEGRAGFSFAHEKFFLFPTRFHATSEQVKGVSIEPQPEWQVGDLVPITHYCVAEWAETFTDWEKVQALAEQHIYSEQTVKDRFFWEGKGMVSGSIHIAKVKVHALSKPWLLPYETKFGGCRSWITLPELPADIDIEA